MQISNKTYDALKKLAQIGLPALGTLYFTIASIWGLPNAEEVVGTIMAVDAFLGILLGVVSVGYNKQNEDHAGYIQQSGVDPDTGHPDIDLTLIKPPAELLTKKTITLHVSDPLTSEHRPGASEVPPA